MTGNDANNGLSPDFAWQTLSKVNSVFFYPNDSILFVCGGVWREQLLPQRNGNSKGYITYSSFGTGEKPLLLGSVNKSDAAKWIYEKNNIWYLIDIFKVDVGNMIFNYATSFGIKKWNLTALSIQGDYWMDKSTGILRIYSIINPALYYNEIECALREHIIDGTNRSYIIYDGLALKYGAAHGIFGANTHHIIVKNCDIAYIGGGDQYQNEVDTIRFGNGIEFWGNAHDNLVERCRIWEIYDAGLTNQNNITTVQQYNITYRYNLIWNCALGSFEYWNRPATSSTKNIYFENNTCLNAGYGWGAQRTDPTRGHLVFYRNDATIDSVFIRNNIFYNASSALIFLVSASNGLDKLFFDYNCYYQPTDTIYIELYPYAYNFSFYQTSTGKDENSIVANPLFVDIFNYDWHLSDSSPCINKGTVTKGKFDFDGTTVPQNNFYDIGAYEHFFITSIKNINNRMNAEIWIYPNPAENFIKYIVNSADNTEIHVKVIDMMGRIIKKKTDNISKGVNEKSIDLSFLARGSYILQIVMENKKKIEKHFLIQ